MPPSSDSLPLPRTAGDFRLERELGRGGMGVVYEAEELSTGRRVALKVLQRELTLSPEAFERFQREARIAASISDSRCVFVYGAHQIEGSPAISMELCPGETLQDRIRAGKPIPIRQAVSWVIDLVEGLEAAESAGIVHRDVKPSNCFLTSDGRVKVGDFGLSRTLDQGMELTQAGQFLGSPLYASPEQARGRPVDSRSDQYSCAATLYALLTGRAPFSATTMGEVLARILSEPPDPMRATRTEIPIALEKIALRALEKDPAKRFTDLASFRAALLPFVEKSAGSAHLALRLGAFLLDGMVTGVLANVLMVFSGMPERLQITVDDTPIWKLTPLWLQIATSCLPILYFGIFEGLLGWTPGKWICGQRVVRLGTGEPHLGSALIRSGSFHALNVTAFYVLSAYARTPNQFQLLLGLASVVIWGVRCSTMRPSNGWRGLHEILSGTWTLRTNPPFVRTPKVKAPPARLPRAEADMPTKVGPYRVLGAIGVTPVGRIFEARDEVLDREVWIHATSDGRSHADPARRNSMSPVRVRWLDLEHEGERTFDIYEAPGGAPIEEFKARQPGLPWALVVTILKPLVEEVRALSLEHGSRLRIDVAQAWIDRRWKARLLDHPLGTTELGVDAATFLSRVASILLLGDVQDERGNQPAYPLDLPGHAESFARRLLGGDEPFKSVDDLAHAFAEATSKPATLPPRSRMAQMSIAYLLPTGFALFGGLIMAFVADVLPPITSSMVALNELKTGRKVLFTADGRTKEALTEDDTRARQISLAHAFNGPFGASVLAGLQPELRAVYNTAIERFPALTEEDHAWAREYLRVQRGSDPMGTIMKRVAQHPYLLAGASVCVMWAIVSTLGALTLRGAITFHMFKILIRDRRGRRASRLLCGARVVIGALPFVLLYGAAGTLVFFDHILLADVLAGLALALQIGTILLALGRPNQGPIDRLLGTRLVPR